MSLTKDDIKLFKDLLKDNNLVLEKGFDQKFEVNNKILENTFNEKLNEKFEVNNKILENKFDEKLDQKFKENNKILEENITSKIIIKVKKIIEDANAEQMELMFKHFPMKNEVLNKNDIREIVREENDNVNRRLIQCEMGVAGNRYKLDVDPVPIMEADLVKIKKNIDMKND